MNSTVPPMSYPRDGGSPVSAAALENEGPSPFHPPVCLKTHWDPTQILKRTLPEDGRGSMALPLDPRPWTRICMEYTTAGELERAPEVPADVVFPSGGQFYPPGRYEAAIDQESQLRRLDRPLGTPESQQWEPNAHGDMFNARILVPDRAPPSDPMRVHEVAYPKALLRAGPYDCREANDRIAMAMSSDYHFNNATKQDRYKQMGKPVKPAPPTETLQGNLQQLLRPDLDFSRVAPPVAGSYERQAREQRAYLQTNAVPTAAAGASSS
jgi:hypothetical protein